MEKYLRYYFINNSHYSLKINVSHDLRSKLRSKLYKYLIYKCFINFKQNNYFGSIFVMYNKIRYLENLSLSNDY